MAKKKSNKTRESYGCMLCPFLCYDVESQARHWLEKHGKKKEEKQPEWPTCMYCQERFRTQDGLDHHYETNHQGTLTI